VAGLKAASVGLLPAAGEQRRPEDLDRRKPGQHERHGERIRCEHVEGQCTISAISALQDGASQRFHIDVVTGVPWVGHRMSPSDTREVSEPAHVVAGGAVRRRELTRCLVASGKHDEAAHLRRLPRLWRLAGPCGPGLWHAQLGQRIGLLL
jgi:hypothetical protein